MSILGVIPSRYASSRFPGKPLVEIGGKTMIRRVYEQAIKSQKLDQVIVATDDQRIFDEISRIGGQAMMTSPNHQNGTERCAEVIEKLSGFDYLINIQGDEPFVHPEQIDQLADILDSKTEIATLVKKIEDPKDLDDPGEIKVVLNRNQEAIYFSRSCIPFSRNHQYAERLLHHNYWKHIGMYGFKKEVLTRITRLEATPLEIAESLEQLRWLENGYQIRAGITSRESKMVDRPEDILKIHQMGWL